MNQLVEQLLYILPRGIGIGLLISAPMGPIGMLVIQRTLSKGRWPALATGVGASLSDIIYCLLSGFCLSFITGFIERNQLLLQMVGGAVLAVFGAYLFKQNPTRALKSINPQSVTNYWSDFISGFLLTFSNPLILFFIIGLFARFNFILPEFGVHHYIWAFFTILVGALMWWWCITLVVSRLRKRINVRSLWIINRMVGSVLIVMAIIGVVMAVHDHWL